MTGSGESRKKTVLLGMPGYAQVTGGAARGFYRSASPDGGLSVLVNYTESSLLALNMNSLWCDALNRRHRGDPIDYHAMQHADVEPQDYWLDVLVAELEARDLDVLSCVVPIKDARGVTSTAVARADGNNWKVKHRLTMAEAYRLPETFTSEDVGGPLLVNTGLWVCRFDRDWVKKVWFTINDRIAWDEAKQVYHPLNEPEDWYISRLFHELGLKVGATRKVQLAHRGPVAFSNVRPWGTHEFDRECLPAAIDMPSAPRPDAFPADCAGWLTEAEGRELSRLAAGKAVLEVGSYCGRSTVCLARAARAVTAVDTFDGRGTGMPGDTEAVFRRNLAKYGVADRVTVNRGPAERILPDLPAVFDLCFIDGAHDRESVARDAELARGVLRPGGLLAFHDYRDPDKPGVTETVDEIIAGGAELLGRVDSLAVVRPAAAAEEPVGETLADPVGV